MDLCKRPRHDPVDFSILQKWHENRHGSRVFEIAEQVGRVIAVSPDLLCDVISTVTGGTYDPLTFRAIRAIPENGADGFESSSVSQTGKDKSNRL